MPKRKPGKRATINRTKQTSLKFIIKDEIFLDNIDLSDNLTVSGEFFRNLLNDLVKRCHPIIVDSHLFVTAYTLYCIDNNLPVQRPDKTFVTYCAKALGMRPVKASRSFANSELFDSLRSFYLNEFQPKHHHEEFDLQYLDPVLDYIAERIESNITTNLKTHFPNRLRSFVNRSGGEHYDLENSIFFNDLCLNKNDKEYQQTKRNILKKTKETILLCKFDEIPEQMKDWFERVRLYILPAEIIENVYHDCETNPYNYLIPCVNMVREYENYNIELDKSIQKYSVRNMLKYEKSLILSAYHYFPFFRFAILIFPALLL